jgi:predicted Rossmann fold nucleotide-binding protein DprA/Smf involved in DNA uptake
MKVLITGSRDTAPEMIEKAIEIVFWCRDHGHEIICGDASGVDTHVVETADLLGVPITVVGSYKMRVRTLKGKNMPMSMSYLGRDEWMARLADRVIAVWNGYSGGTRYTFMSGLKFHKPTFVIDFSLPKEKRQENWNED